MLQKRIIILEYFGGTLLVTSGSSWVPFTIVFRKTVLFHGGYTAFSISLLRSQEGGLSWLPLKDGFVIVRADSSWGIGFRPLI